MTTTHRITTTAAVLLSLAAAGAPPAGARPADLVPPSLQSPTAVYSRPDREMIAVSPPPAYSGAVARTAALRSSAQQERQRVVALTAYTEGQIAAARDVEAQAPNKASASQAAARVNAPQNGFDWGDAAIGAAGGIAIALLATDGGLVAIRTRRDHLDPATR